MTKLDNLAWSISEMSIVTPIIIIIIIFSFLAYGSHNLTLTKVLTNSEH